MRVLPKPYPDELLYSIIARTAYHYGYWSPTQLLLPLFGSREVIAVPDLPSNLAALAARTSEAWGLSAEELAVRHTLLGYYTHFQGSRLRQDILASMYERGGFNQVRLGICAGSALSPKRFRLCLQCHEEDKMQSHAEGRLQYGETYWHRSHQLPGVLVCDRHGIVLHETSVLFRPVGRHDYTAAPQEVLHTELRPIAGVLQRPEVAQRIAMHSASLLNQAPRCTDALPDYREVLAAHGFTSRNGGAKHLRVAVRDCLGADLVEQSLRAEAGRDPLQWLEEVLRKPRRPMHPYRHVLMEVFLALHDPREVPVASDPVTASASRWGLSRQPSLRHEAELMAKQGFSTHAIASALDVDWKTAKRLVEPIDAPATKSVRDERVDRDAWTALASEHPSLGKKNLRQLAPALYARLYRNDRAWLQSFRAGGRVASSPRARVDWGRRDAMLSERVRSQARAILTEMPMRRVSRSHLLGCLEARALIAHQAKKLPQTIAALDEVCESVEEFQTRRLAKVIGDHQDAQDVTDGQALWEARINRSRLADRGRMLVARARARCNSSPMQGGASVGG